MQHRRRLPLLVAALAVTAAASACTSVNGTDGKNFVTSDGVVIEIPAKDRKAPVSVEGESLTGEPIDLADLRGQPVVVNVWGAWCTACRAEAKTLVAAQQKLPAGTTMLGIDVRDSSKDDALAYERGYGVQYSSIYDPGSQTLLEFPAPYNPRDIPSTMVLDSQGRVAAIIRGQLPSELTLVEVVQKVAAEDADSRQAADG
jgi:thiol-disulfide isomerase/thioredoxin